MSQESQIGLMNKLNLENDTIDLRGSIAPIKLISRIISVVPAIGELITGLKKEGLFAGQFKMTGSIGDPEVKLNTLSFAPGILREIFSEDWLNQDNFLKYTQIGESDIDIFIRTGGDMRLSNFLLPNIGYSELFFTEKL